MIIVCDNQGWWTTQHFRDFGWQNTCAQDMFGCKRRGMKAGWMVVKIRTERNLVDLLRKLLPFSRIQELCKLVGVEYDEDFMTREAPDG